jgi:hypothetical protein
MKKCLSGTGALLISRQFFQRVSAGNAVRFGDSGAAVTGYEPSFATSFFANKGLGKAR